MYNVYQYETELPWPAIPQADQTGRYYSRRAPPIYRLALSIGITTFCVGVGNKVPDEAMVAGEVAVVEVVADLDGEMGSHCMMPLEVCLKDSASL